MVRFAVIGTNWITESFIKAGTELEDFTLTAVYSRTAERASAFATKHGAPHIFTDLETMAKSKEFDAVYIASPNSYHAQQAITLMNGGKHVICEKPIASNSRELREMVATAKENGVLLMEALKSTLLPNFKSIRANLEKIGAIRKCVFSYCQYSSRYDAYLNGTVLNAFNPSFSNGALMDIGIYCLYPMVVLFGKPNSIKASGVLLDSGVDGEGSILMSYEDKEGVMMFSKITNSNLPSEIQGEKGNMIINNINIPKKVEIHYRDGSIEDISVPQRENEMYYEIEEFIKLIKQNKLESQINSHQTSLSVAEIMEASRKQVGVVFPADNN